MTESDAGLGAHDWLLLVQSITSHGPPEPARTTSTLNCSTAPPRALYYVTAYPSQAIMTKYLGDTSWETELCYADTPTRLIHFYGERFLGPYERVEQ